MLDLLEAGLAGLRLDSAAVGAPEAPVPVGSLENLAEPEALRAELQACGLTLHEVAESLGVATTTLEDWLAGRAAAPALVLTAIQLLRRVTFSERRKLQKNGAAPGVKQEPAAKDSVLRHPFSRIEEL